MTEALLEKIITARIANDKKHEVVLAGFKSAPHVWYSVHTKIGIKTVGLFNPEQLATWDESKLIGKHFLEPYNGRLIGGGLKPITNSPFTSGIYIYPWVGGPAGFPEPRIGNARGYLFRFKNNFESVNCGLVRELFAKYPVSPGYVMSQLANEIGF